LRLPFFAVGFLISISAIAGELENLPDTETAFNKKVEASIKSGSSIKDAISLLESSRFTCKELEGDKNTIWCSRTDGGVLSSVVRRYQVILRGDGMQVLHVETSTGLVGL
jgi:hypothetical protein